MSSVCLLLAELDQPAHQLAVVELTDAYSRDVMGAGKPLDDDVKARLVPGLRAHPTTLVFLAYALERPVGMALCFRGFSSFAAKPLINVHDLSVLQAFRGKGIGRQLLGAVIEHAKQTGCCKVTLETQEQNHAAQRLYRSLGFERQMYVEEVGGAIFMACAL
jgi:ribosomal protein S18 acetylase RimI-like enzyme